jgi:DNA polymerase-1
MTPLLVLDCHYLCHRAYHAQGQLSWKGDATGVIFGFLKGIAGFKDEFSTDRIAFCFEGGDLVRRKIYAEYKSGRAKHLKTPEEKRAYDQLAVQIKALRKHYLPQIGFKNIFDFHGFESDDVMAAIARDCQEKGQECILVTADSDMYQCLGPGVTIWHPQKQVRYDREWFISQYGIKPSKWAVVKAIAGCHSDNVKGIYGVGEKTALRFLTKDLPRTSEAFRKITCKAGKFIVRSNKRLVKLPMDGCPVPRIQDDQVSRAGWQEVCKLLGMRTLAGQPPILTRRLGLID